MQLWVNNLLIFGGGVFLGWGNTIDKKGVSGVKLRALWRALRAFSLTCAFIPTTFGGLLAWRATRINPHHFLLLIVAGVLLQSGVNFINDYYEHRRGLFQRPLENGVTQKEIDKLVFNAGIVLMVAVVPLGLYLVYHSGWHLLIIGIVGLLGGYYYTAPPIRYKDRGLGVFLVFFLMGVLMIYGSYYALHPNFSWSVIWLSLPISFLTSLLLLSNEIRDYQVDKRHNIHTLTVAKGLSFARHLYYVLAVAAFVSLLALIMVGLLPLVSLSAFAALLPLRIALKYLYLPHQQRTPLTPKTAKVHFVLGMMLNVSLLTTVMVANLTAI